MMPTEPAKDKTAKASDSEPPFFPKWGYWYGLVLGFLLLQVLGFWILGKWFE